MEFTPTTYNQIKEAFRLGRQITYGKTLVNKVEGGKIQTVTKEGLFKPWLPAVRIIVPDFVEKKRESSVERKCTNCRTELPEDCALFCDECLGLRGKRRRTWL